jgi:hypothetical protein
LRFVLLEIAEGSGFGWVVVEQVEESGEFERVTEVGAEIGESESSPLCGYFATRFDQSAEAGTVYRVDVLEIDDDSRGARGQKIVNAGTKAGAFLAEGETSAKYQNIEAVSLALCNFQRHRKRPMHYICEPLQPSIIAGQTTDR